MDIGLLRIPRAQQADRVVTVSHGESGLLELRSMLRVVNFGWTATPDTFFTTVSLFI
jgi:hypothetical protein